VARGDSADDGDRVSEVWTRGATGLARHEWSGLGRDPESTQSDSAREGNDVDADAGDEGAFATITTPLPSPFLAETTQGDASRTTPGSDGGDAWQLGAAHMGRPRERLQSFMRIHEVPATHASARGSLHESEVSFGQLRYVAQVRGTYLICEGDDGLFVLDQHAAAERVNFHKLKQEYAQQKMASQALLFPVTLQLTAEQCELVGEHEPDIAALGFDVRIHSETTVSVHRVPRLLQRDSTERLFLDLLSELGRAGRGFSAAVDAALSTIACHGSVRAGDVMNTPQAEALLKSLDGVDFAGHCPHGRPIVSFTSWSELERKVGRR
jgi:DNA mismatch repair protein MutL